MIVYHGFYLFPQPTWTRQGQWEYLGFEEFSFMMKKIFFSFCNDFVECPAVILADEINKWYHSHKDSLMPHPVVFCYEISWRGLTRTDAFTQRSHWTVGFASFPDRFKRDEGGENPRNLIYLIISVSFKSVGENRIFEFSKFGKSPNKKHFQKLENLENRQFQNLENRFILRLSFIF